MNPLSLNFSSLHPKILPLVVQRVALVVPDRAMCLTQPSGVHDELGTEMTLYRRWARQHTPHFLLIFLLPRAAEQPFFVMKNLCSGLFLLIALLFTACSPEELPVPIQTTSSTNAPQALVVMPNNSHTAELDSEYATVELRVIDTDYAGEQRAFWLDLSGDYDFSEVKCAPLQELRFTTPAGKILTRRFPVQVAQGSNGKLFLEFGRAGFSSEEGSKNSVEIDSTQTIVIEDDIVM